MVRIALVGAGGIANRHVEAISGIDGANIVAVVDPIKEKAAHLGSSAKTPCPVGTHENSPAIHCWESNIYNST